MALLESGQIDLAPLVSHVVPLSEWERAFGLVGSIEAIKVVIDPS
jgi:threonine dehydrogenase-like Zn-dependent dehydrogenase